MTSELPSWLGYLIGGSIFCLVGVALSAILIYALRESKRVAEMESRQVDLRRPPAAEESTTGRDTDTDSLESREDNSERSSRDETKSNEQ